MKLRRCAYHGCLTPSVLLVVDGPRNGAVKFHAACRRLHGIARQAAYRRRVGRPVYSVGDVDASDDPVVIETTFQQALAVIKRRERPEPIVGWSSPLTRLES